MRSKLVREAGPEMGEEPAVAGCTRASARSASRARRALRRCPNLDTL